ncbi:MAG TPA: N-methyl-L-tryptophan oxidase [Candidatus Dormibacteraeota bacterium]|nr:N-methyl-L-tryptophan oxidase [Candidatus Dormibacteraeota bacterium]
MTAQDRDADVLVVGVGSMGSMACWRLARRGASVLALERFSPGHDRGSGHGGSRLIRSAYYEGSGYVPLVRRAFELWRELEAETGIRLLTTTGALMIGPPQGELVAGALRSAREHDLPHRLLEAEAARRRFPQHRIGPDEVVLWEAQAGILRPEPAIRAAASRAVALGARLLTGLRASRVQVEGGGVTVEAGGRRFRAARAVVSVGPWLPSLLPDLGLPLRVERQVMAWFRPQDEERFRPHRFPPFMRDRGGWHGYGIPALPADPDLEGPWARPDLAGLVKVAIHHGGAATDPDRLDRRVGHRDLAPVAALVAETLIGLEPWPERAEVCMYTNTPDLHFVVGQVPSAPELVVLGGFSGHGFKFAPVIGEAAADLVLEGRTALPVAAFSPGRFR